MLESARASLLNLLQRIQTASSPHPSKAAAQNLLWQITTKKLRITQITDFDKTDSIQIGDETFTLNAIKIIELESTQRLYFFGAPEQYIVFLTLVNSSGVRNTHCIVLSAENDKRMIRGLHAAYFKKSKRDETFIQREALPIYWHIFPQTNYLRDISPHYIPLHSAIVTAVNDLIATFHNTGQKVTLFDIGCGNGLLLIHLAESLQRKTTRIHALSGYDANAEAIANANRALTTAQFTGKGSESIKEKLMFEQQAMTPEGLFDKLEKAVGMRVVIMSGFLSADVSNGTKEAARYLQACRRAGAIALVTAITGIWVSAEIARFIGLATTQTIVTTGDIPRPLYQFSPLPLDQQLTDILARSRERSSDPQRLTLDLTLTAKPLDLLEALLASANSAAGSSASTPQCDINHIVTIDFSWSWLDEAEIPRLIELLHSFTNVTEIIFGREQIGIADDLLKQYGEKPPTLYIRTDDEAEPRHLPPFLDVSQARAFGLYQKDKLPAYNYSEFKTQHPVPTPV